MDCLWHCYHDKIPDFIRVLAARPPMQRLKQVGMNCGCEYTSFPRFAGLGRSSRYAHSVGTALIVWHFTADRRQAAAGLFHDIATPAFAHVIDFLNGDYLRQESTEQGTAALIAGMRQELSAWGLTVEEVSDYHRYPLADNDPPRLSADRLEYTLRNCHLYRLLPDDALKALYDDLQPGCDEQGAPELVFTQPETALRFARAALECSKIYVSHEDRYAMQRLALLLADAIRRGVLSKEQLFTTEPEVIARLVADAEASRQWHSYRACAALAVSEEKPAQDGWLQIPAKKRYINPMVAGKGRVGELFADFDKALQAFLQQPQTQWLRAVQP